MSARGVVMERQDNVGQVPTSTDRWRWRCGCGCHGEWLTERERALADGLEHQRLERVWGE
jgi:hypothetical protein